MRHRCPFTTLAYAHITRDSRSPPLLELNFEGRCTLWSAAALLPLLHISERTRNDLEGTPSRAPIPEVGSYDRRAIKLIVFLLLGYPAVIAGTPRALVHRVPQWQLDPVVVRFIQQHKTVGIRHRVLQDLSLLHRI